MRAYNVVRVTETDGGEPDVYIEAFINRDKAKARMDELLKKKCDDMMIDLTDPSNDGICYGNDDSIYLYKWVGGDWCMTLSIYEVEIQ